MSTIGSAVRRNIIVSIVAVGGGYLGSALHDCVTAKRSIIRAERFEVVERSGRVRSYWGSDGGAFTLLDERGYKAVELSANRGMRSLAFFDGKGEWQRMGLLTSDDGIAFLSFGDNYRQGRLTIGTVDDSDIPSSSPPTVWGLVVRGRGQFQYPFSALVRDPSQEMPTTGLVLVRPDKTRWVAP